MKTPIMPSRRATLAALAASVAVPPAGLSSTQVRAQTADPLASWNDGPRKQAILDFVLGTTDKASAKFVPADQRIATFDNDGTLWAEQPLYTQLLFALDGSVATFRHERGELQAAPWRNDDKRLRFGGIIPSRAGSSLLK